MLSDDPILACIVVRRNQSLTVTGLAGFLLMGFALHFGLGLFAGLEGWWPVVAFVGGAFLAQAVAVFAVMSGALEREVITVRPDTITIEYGRRRPRVRMQMQRFGARVVYESGSPGRLYLQSRATVLELGSALSAAERRSLGRRLAELIGPGTEYQGPRKTAMASA